MSDARLQAEISTFLIGGFETTGHTLSYTLLELAAHPQVQETLFRELVAAGLAPGKRVASLLAAEDSAMAMHAEAASQKTGDSAAARQLEYEDLGKLRYLDDVIRESMRLHSVGLTTLRQCAPRTMLVLLILGISFEIEEDTSRERERAESGACAVQQAGRLFVLTGQPCGHKYWTY